MQRIEGGRNQRLRVPWRGGRSGRPAGLCSSPATRALGPDTSARGPGCCSSLPPTPCRIPIRPRSHAETARSALRPPPPPLCAAGSDRPSTGSSSRRPNIFSPRPLTSSQAVSVSSTGGHGGRSFKALTRRSPQSFSIPHRTDQLLGGGTGRVGGRQFRKTLQLPRGPFDADARNGRNIPSFWFLVLWHIKLQETCRAGALLLSRCGFTTISTS
jgi:hypothetical protein